jgi:hypothetical protein
MSVPVHRLENAADVEPIERDDLSNMVDRSWDELFGMDRIEREEFQLGSLRRRFDELLPKLSSLRIQVEDTGISRIGKLEDVVPLLFHDSVYKSYPVSLIEKNQFDRLTKWLSGYTTVDLTNVDASKCDGVDRWIDTLDAQTPLRVIHTSGTSGKLSFFPRSTVEIRSFFKSHLKVHEGFGAEPGVRLGDGQTRMIVVNPVPRYGRQIRHRCFPLMQKYVTPAPDQLYTLDYEVRADLVSLSGRIRIAQAKGELSRITLSDSQRAAMVEYLADLERRPADAAGFYQRVANELRGKRVMAGGFANLLQDAARAGLERGVRNIFAPGSIGMTGGGNKDGVLLPNWLDLVREFTGIRKWAMNYGMSEMISMIPMGDEGWYHVPPYVIPFLLDPVSGVLLPRKGVVAGRLAFYDLLAQTNWGGIISGDKVTIDWDGLSPSGRKAPRIRSDITRYSAEITGEDKVTCASTVDQTDAALQALLAR